ncbi:MAG TPA: glutathione peroxidase [Bdellovibrionales bacterium]|nr:glutathione peroxidase [Bdellovibrionales bacterium]
MKKLLALLTFTQFASATKPPGQTLHDFKVKTPDNTEQSLERYKGKVVLVVNVASKCGYTPQYEELEKIYETYKDKGFVILGFPCNQFGGQEPGTNEEIQKFCKVNFGVTFPVMAKIEVNGDGAIPLYKWLKSSAPGVLGTEAIKWNFTKFLIGKDGKVIARYSPQTKPSEISKEIEKAL